MNHYDRHIGDWLKDTVQLSACEEGIYSRLIDQYYSREQCLPLDEVACCRLARAQTREERAAVLTALTAFFVRDGDGYRHKRCDDVIADYQAHAGDTEQRRENERERSKRHRERRKELFAALREVGAVPEFDTPTADLEAMLSRAASRNNQRDGHAASTHNVTHDVTANHSPVPIKEKEQKARKRAVVTQATRPDDVPEAVWRDFLAIRERKRAPLTPTALEGIQREAKRAGLTLAATLAKCCDRGWQGFEAKWLEDERGGVPAADPAKPLPPRKPVATQCGGTIPGAGRCRVTAFDGGLCEDCDKRARASMTPEKRAQAVSELAAGLLKRASA